MVLSTAALLGASAIGAAGSIGAGLLGNSGGTSVWDSIKLANYQNKIQRRYDQWYLNNISKKQLLNGPSWTRKGYESAGFNPMLTYMNGVGQFTNAGNVGMPNVQKDHKGNTVADAINTGAQNIIGAVQADANVNNTNANTALVNEQAKTEQAKRVQMDFQNALSDVQTKLHKKDLSTYERRFYIDMYEKMQRAEKYRNEANVTSFNAQTARMQANAMDNLNDIKRYDAVTNRYKNTKSLSFPFGAGFSSTGYPVGSSDKYNIPGHSTWESKYW